MTLNVSLTPQLEELVKAKVSSGMYNSASELVREALRLLDERDQVREMRLQALRKAVQEGIDSGPGIPADKVFSSVRAKIDAVAEKKRRDAVQQ